MIQTKIRKNLYLDSIFLMTAGQKMMSLDGVQDAVLVMGTDMNKTVLQDFGAAEKDYAPATANDLVLCLDVDKPELAEEAMTMLESMVHAKGGGAAEGGGIPTYASVGQALDSVPDSNLVFISVPGDFAGGLARQALENGKSVFIFSDNVPLEDEVALKQLARAKGLWVFGPGCGTSVLDGKSVGMMSSVNKGPIGIVGASGSGIHEIAVLIDRAGLGITQAIGTGGRDLSQAVGGITMRQGLRFLMDDPDTKVIVLVSKPPHPEVAASVLADVKGSAKPVVVFFLGGDQMQLPSDIYKASSLEDAAAKAVSLAKGEKPKDVDELAKYKAEFADRIKTIRSQLKTQQKYLRGIFCGGTHTEEAILQLRHILPKINANVSFGGSVLLASAKTSVEHSLIDIGDEEFTKGKPHAVVEPSVMTDRLIKEALDPEVAVVLFDLLLGYGANADPVGVLSGAIESAQKKLAGENRKVAFVATITGTERDPQNFKEQVRRLEALGVTVLPSNLQAAVFAGLLAVA